MATAPKDPKELTAAAAAKLVKRTVVTVKTDKEGKVTSETSQVEVKSDELLAWKDYGTRVVVVTKDGQKLIAETAEA